MPQVDDLVERIFTAVKRYVDVGLAEITRATKEEVSQRIDALPKPKDGDPGAPGVAGTSVTLDDVAPLVANLVKQEVAALPPAPAGEPGEPGKAGADGVSVSIEQVMELVKQEVAALPPAVPGEPGKDAPPVDLEALQARVVAEVVVSAREALEPGSQGDPGPPGPPGPPGEPGQVDEQAIVARVGKDATAYLDAYGKELTSSVQAYAKEMAVPGIQGEPGKDGKDAELDVDVLKEVLGELVPPLLQRGPAGVDGEPGPPGPPGQDGAEGQDGKPGSDGRDALELEPLPAIDQERSYARGTWACHAGGLVRAARATDPLAGASLLEAGWAVMVAGIDKISFTQSDGDERVFCVELIKTGGMPTPFYCSVSSLIYRGVWEPARRYERGDVVTRDGSMWHAEKESAASEPGLPGGAWKLAVKRGSQGSAGQPEKTKNHEPVRVR